MRILSKIVLFTESFGMHISVHLILRRCQHDSDVQTTFGFFRNGKKGLILSFIFHMCNSVFEMLPIIAVLTVLNGILLSLSSGYMPVKTAWAAFGIMLLSILGRILFTNLSAVKEPSEVSLCVPNGA